MPKLSDTMEEGTVLQWLKADGDLVAKGEQIVEVETDKANMMVEAPEAGVLSIIAVEGQSLPVGAPIAAIGDAGALPAASETGAAASAEEQTNIPVGDDGTGREIGLEIGGRAAGGGGEAAGAGDDGERGADAGEGEWAGAAHEGEWDAAPEPPALAEPASPPRERETDARMKSSPLARRLAAEMGVDLQMVRGTGPDGRIVRTDIEAAARGDAGARRAAAPPPAAPAPTPPPPAAPVAPTAAPAAVAPGERVPLTRLQKTIARRMVESATQAPHFYLQRDIDVTDAIALRRTLVDAAPEGRGRASTTSSCGRWPWPPPSARTRWRSSTAMRSSSRPACTWVWRWPSSGDCSFRW